MVVLAAIVWISGMTAWAIVSTFRPLPVGGLKLDLFDELNGVEHALEWALPLGAVGLIVCTVRMGVTKDLKWTAILALLVGLLGTAACAIAFWQALDWVHGPDIRLWDRIWWAIK